MSITRCHIIRLITLLVLGQVCTTLLYAQASPHGYPLHATTITPTQRQQLKVVLDLLLRVDAFHQCRLLHDPDGSREIEYRSWYMSLDADDTIRLQFIRHQLIRLLGMMAWSNPQLHRIYMSLLQRAIAFYPNDFFILGSTHHLRKLLGELMLSALHFGNDEMMQFLAEQEKPLTERGLVDLQSWRNFRGRVAASHQGLMGLSIDDDYFNGIFDKMQALQVDHAHHLALPKMQAAPFKHLVGPFYLRNSMLSQGQDLIDAVMLHWFSLCQQLLTQARLLQNFSDPNMTPTVKQRVTLTGESLQKWLSFSARSVNNPANLEALHAMMHADRFWESITFSEYKTGEVLQAMNGLLMVATPQTPTVAAWLGVGH